MRRTASGCSQNNTSGSLQIELCELYTLAGVVCTHGGDVWGVPANMQEAINKSETGLSHRLTSGASFPPRLILLEWVIGRIDELDFVVS